jgi:hypothetical protein
MASSPPPDRVLALLDERLRDNRQIDLGLGAVAGHIAVLPPQQGLVEARQLLVKRAVDLQAAVADVSATIQRLRGLELVVRFTEAGWATRRDELMAACGVDAVHGLAEWLDDWFTALAALRLDAVDRLVSLEPSLPPGTGMLVRRCRATSAALDSRDWDVAAPLLETGARGVAVGSDSVPSTSVRRDLWVLLVRLALAVERPDDARSALAEASRAGGGPILDALAERLKSLDSSGGPVRGDLMTIGGSSEDALLELARVVNITAGASGSSDLRIDTGMTAARTAIASAPSLDGADEQVARLLDPVPAEIYLALAERALLEDAPDLAERSLARVTTTALNAAVRGEAYDQLAILARRAGDGERERTQRLAAAKAWDSAERPDRILASTDALITLDPGHAEARCLAAGSLSQLSWNAPKEVALPQLRRALEILEPVAEIVDSQANQLADPDWLRAWALCAESLVRVRLADFDGEHQADQRWRALLAAMRAVAVRPTKNWVWTATADAAYANRMWSLAELAAREASRLDPSRETSAEHVRALANLGEFTRALEVLGEPGSPFEWSMQAHVHIHLGQPAVAAAVFDAHPPLPDFRWARLSNVNALLLVGRRDEAVAAAKDLDASMRARLTETGVRSTSARLALIVGNDERAETLSEEVRANGEHDSDFDLAVIRTVQGRESEAATLFASYVRDFTSLDDVACWENIDRHLLSLVLADRGIPHPDLSEAQGELDALRTRLAARRDPVAELDLTESDGADGTAVAAAKEVGRTIVELAREDLVGDTAGANPLVAGQLDDESVINEDLLRGASSSGVTAEAVSVVRSLTGDPALGSLAQVVSAGLDPEPAAADVAPAAPQPFALSTELPPSWFATVTNPTEQHELFLRHLPAMRLTSAAVVPAVSVSTDAALEPGGYRVLVHDDVVEEGILTVGRRLLPESALALLSKEHIQGVAREEQPALREIGEVSIPAPEGGEQTLAALLSVSPVEAVVRRLEAAASASAVAQAPIDLRDT